MEPIDPKTARQVWKRVTTAPVRGMSPGDLHGLLVSAIELSALYRSLAISLGGKQREAAQNLVSGQQDTIFALRGMQLKSFGRGTPIPAEPSHQKKAQRILELCYPKAKSALTEYSARAIDTDFGPVFRLLAAREEKHCLEILALLGQV